MSCSFAIPRTRLLSPRTAFGSTVIVDSPTFPLATFPVYVQERVLRSSELPTRDLLSTFSVEVRTKQHRSFPSAEEAGPCYRARRPGIII